MSQMKSMQWEDYIGEHCIKKEKFLELYSACFDTDGNVKLCGRDACKELITYIGEDFGNLKTGFMNVDRIKMLHQIFTQQQKDRAY